MHDPVTPLLIRLALLMCAAKLAGWIALKARQPAVLGEILIGILLGNLALLGFHGLEPIKTDPILAILAGLGVILLLFEVGLQSTVKEMLHVGGSSALVATLGVVTPMALGWAAGAWLLPDESPLVHAFLGAVLTATSVGITARVLRDLDLSQTVEARIILGAAVIDDVLGLVILAALAGIITAADQGRGGLSAPQILWISAKALGFLLGAILLGLWLTPKLLAIASRVRVKGALLTTGLVFCFVLAYLGTLAGLSPIVGAFAAGLILESGQFKDFEESRESSIESLLHPISTFLVPIFFVLTGFRVALDSFADGRIVVLALVLTLAAWIGKQACSLGVLERGTNRLAIGLGMVPRGEVGLIFANVGATLSIAGRPVITPDLYAAVVIMVILTTLVTPGLLQWSLRGRAGRLAHTRAQGTPQC
ncbi:MAG TPA: cation:proton antiporter [Candidatus Limnocylindrales bacterium]|nr:cation:proton antiporter [Candidatus Limnocylindrales bacterium]